MMEHHIPAAQNAEEAGELAEVRFWEAANEKSLTKRIRLFRFLHVACLLFPILGGLAIIILSTIISINYGMKYGIIFLFLSSPCLCSFLFHEKLYSARKKCEEERDTLLVGAERARLQAEDDHRRIVRNDPNNLV